MFYYPLLVEVKNSLHFIKWSQNNMYKRAQWNGNRLYKMRNCGHMQKGKPHFFMAAAQQNERHIQTLLPLRNITARSPSCDMSFLSLKNSHKILPIYYTV